MIDIRVLRDDPDGRQGRARPPGRRSGRGRRLVALDAEPRAAVGARDELRAEVKELSRQVGEARRAGDDGPGRRARRTRAGPPASEERALHAEADARPGARCARRCSTSPTSRRPTRPTGTVRGQRRVRRWWPATSRPTYGRAPAGAALGDRRRARHPRHGARGQAGRLDVPPLPGAGRPAAPGAHRLRPRPATPTPTRRSARRPWCCTETMTSTGHLPKFADDAYHLERDDLWAIPTAEVPLTSMHRGEILEESELPLRSPRRPPATGARRARPAATPGACCGCTSSTRSSSSPTPPPTRHRHCSSRHPGAGRGAAPGARSSPTGCSTCAPATSAARRPAPSTSRSTPPASTVARGLLGQLVPRLPGPPGQRPLPARRGGRPVVRPHGQRLGAGLAPHLGRPGGERAPGRRLGRAARRARALPRRRDGHPGALERTAPPRRSAFDARAGASKR